MIQEDQNENSVPRDVHVWWPSNRQWCKHTLRVKKTSHLIFVTCAKWQLSKLDSVVILQQNTTLNLSLAYFGRYIKDQNYWNSEEFNTITSAHFYKINNKMQFCVQVTLFGYFIRVLRHFKQTNCHYNMPEIAWSLLLNFFPNCHSSTWCRYGSLGAACVAK